MTAEPNSYGLTICEYCGAPNEIHGGFDHGNGKCLLMLDHISLSLRYRDREQRVDLVNRVNAWYAEQEALDNIGAGI